MYSMSMCYKCFISLVVCPLKYLTEKEISVAYLGKYVTSNMPLNMTLNKTVIGHFSDDLFLTK